METYITGTGQKIAVHSESDCYSEFCCIHNPSNHKTKNWPTHWREDRGIMERMCTHGVGHPDPDDIAFKKAIAKDYGRGDYDAGIHGCDGCCKE